MDLRTWRDGASACDDQQPESHGGLAHAGRIRAIVDLPRPHDLRDRSVPDARRRGAAVPRAEQAHVRSVPCLRELGAMLDTPSSLTQLVGVDRCSNEAILEFPILLGIPPTIPRNSPTYPSGIKTCLLYYFKFVPLTSDNDRYVPPASHATDRRTHSPDPAQPRGASARERHRPAVPRQSDAAHLVGAAAVCLAHSDHGLSATDAQQRHSARPRHFAARERCLWHYNCWCRSCNCWCCWCGRCWWSGHCRHCRHCRERRCIGK